MLGVSILTISTKKKKTILQIKFIFTFKISIIVLYTFRISLNFHNVQLLPVTYRKKLYERIT
jgi:hypothetical protein